MVVGKVVEIADDCVVVVKMAVEEIDVDVSGSVVVDTVVKVDEVGIVIVVDDIEAEVGKLAVDDVSDVVVAIVVVVVAFVVVVIVVLVGQSAR